MNTIALVLVVTTLLNTTRDIAAPEKDWAQHMGDLVVSPVLAQDVGGVLCTRNVPEVHDLRSDRFSDPMVGESGPTFILLANTRNA